MLRNVSLSRRSVPNVETPSVVSGRVCAVASMLILAVAPSQEHAQQNADAKGHADRLIRICTDDAIGGFCALNRLLVELRQSSPCRRQARRQTSTRLTCFFR